MRFMLLLKSDDNAEAGVMPDEKILVEMGKFNDELVKAGVLLMAEGLHPSSKGVRLRNSGGKLTVIDGPFAEAKELVAGFWMIEAKSKEEAIEWAKRCPFEAAGPSAMTGGSGQIEIRQISVPSGPPSSEAAPESHGSPESRPAEPPKSSEGDKKIPFMAMFKATADSEAGVPPSPKIVAEMGKGMMEMARAGVLLAADGLEASSKGARVQFTAGKRTVIDGPFAETKELIAGFAILRVKSKEEAIAWAERGLRIHGDGECEIRQVFSEADFPAELVAAVPEVFESEREFRERAKG